MAVPVPVLVRPKLPRPSSTVPDSTRPLPTPALLLDSVLAAPSVSVPLSVPAPLLLASVPPALSTALPMLAPPARSSVAPLASCTLPLPICTAAPDRRSVPASTRVPPP